MIGSCTTEDTMFRYSKKKTNKLVTLIRDVLIRHPENHNKAHKQGKRESVQFFYLTGECTFTGRTRNNESLLK